MFGATVGRTSSIGGALLLVLLAGPGCERQTDDAVPPAASENAAMPEPDAGPIVVVDVGFETPESVLHDTAADVYIVSNIRGGPSDKANNGFITRLSPAGQVLELHWIEGGRDGVVLHAPKGLALKGDSLFVADIDSVRIFHRETGAPIGTRGATGAGFLNALAVGPDGVLYASDTGIRFGPGGAEPIGTDAIFRFTPAGVGEPLARGAELQNANGLVADGNGVIVVPFGGNEVFRIDANGQRSTIATLPAGQLDGVVRLSDGALLVSSWEGQAIYRIDPGGAVTVMVDGVETPADIGYDATRGRVLIPGFNGNRVDIVPVR